MENTSNNQSLASEKLSFDRFRLEVLKDYRMACESREASLLGRKEVLTGKAKFGIFGDGKEIAQIAAAKIFYPAITATRLFRLHSARQPLNSFFHNFMRIRMRTMNHTAVAGK